MTDQEWTLTRANVRLLEQMTQIRNDMTEIVRMAEALIPHCNDIDALDRIIIKAMLLIERTA